MKKILAGLLAIASFTFSANAQEQHNMDRGKTWNKDGMGNHMRHHGKGMMAMQKLNLTDAQKQQMKLIQEEFKNKFQALNKNDNMMVKDFRAQKESLLQERKNKIEAILTPEQRTQFEKFHSGMDRMREGRMADMKMDGRRMEHMKTELGLTDEQMANMKAGGEAFRAKAKAIHDNTALTEAQKKEQFEALQKERQANVKSYLTSDQIKKFDAMQKNHGERNEKYKDGERKEKIKSSDGKIK